MRLAALETTRGEVKVWICQASSFAERVAERLEARADALEHGSRSAGHGAATSCVTELRTAAALAREEAAAVTQEEAPPPEAQA